MLTHIKPLRFSGLPENFRIQIKEARKKRGWGQRKLASLVGLQQPHISAIESGEIVPRFDTLIEIVRVLDLDLILVPRPLVPAVQSLIRAGEKSSGDTEQPLYAISDEERENGGDGDREL
jgi:HTH-type transcriptional regulator / antitoxin HipB